MVIFGLLVAISGLAANYISTSLYGYEWRQRLDLSYRIAQSTMMYPENRSYSRCLDEWYESAVIQRLTSRDSVELSMRRADKITVDEFKDELPRLLGAKQADDTLLAYRVTGGNGSSANMYAFLIRNDAVFVSAIKKPNDAHWVEKGANSEAYSYFFSPNDLTLAMVAGWMFGTACFLMMIYFIIATIRWAFARLTYQPRRISIQEPQAVRGGIDAPLAKPS